MTPADFTVENTVTGQQYVIPRTERIIKPKRPPFRTETTPAGDEFMIPGIEPISTKEYLAWLVDRPLAPGRGQIGLRGTGLFGATEEG